jgi:ribosomal protein RSM22 (predicted rRNA methylase)
LVQGNLLVDKNEAFDRLLISPQKRGRHVIMKACGQDGEITTRIIAKSDGAIYKEARKVRHMAHDTTNDTR